MAGPERRNLGELQDVLRQASPLTTRRYAHLMGAETAARLGTILNAAAAIPKAER